MKAASHSPVERASDPDCQGDGVDGELADRLAPWFPGLSRIPGTGI